MRNFRYALFRVAPILAFYFFLGIGFGVIFVKEGFSPLHSYLSGLFIYAGSMQMALVPLLASEAPLYFVALMTLFINGRMMFYGISFLEKFQSMGKAYPYMIHTTTDETYSVLVSMEYPEDVDEKKVDFFVHLLCHLTWSSSCLVGALLGGLIPFSVEGIDFLATAFFVTVVVEQLRWSSSKIPFFVGLVSAVFFLLVLGPANFIVPAIVSSMLLLLMFRSQILEKEEN